VLPFNEGGDAPLPLSDPKQRMMAGYESTYQSASTGEGQRKPSATEQPEVEQNRGIALINDHYD
jgi:hypothetical protein